MSKSFISGLIIAFSVIAGGTMAQDTPQTPVPTGSALADETLAKYKKQATQMVSFMEFAFNTLGSSRSEYKEKDIIINQSYLKFFKDSKVQIEDDLVENRDVVTNKDVQAYLKDIDFFFTDVVFKFIVEEITQELNEKGGIFFKVRTNRNIQGTSIEGKNINDNKTRFIEINLDDAKGELKIASIYTTRTGEEQELIAWWNNLDPVWRRFFGANTLVLDSIPLRDVAGIGRDYIFILPEGIPKEDSVFYADTIKLNPATVFMEIRRILRAEQVNISGIKGIFDLEPISALTSLKHLNISGASISGMEPARNLSKLETLNASASLVASLLPLLYCSNLRYLDVSSTFVTDISIVENFNKLETLDISGIQADNLKAVSKLALLRELRLNQSAIRSLEGIEQLSSLEVLEISDTPVVNILPAGKLSALQILSMEKTFVSDITPLASLPSLEYIYLDNTPVNDLSPLKNIASLKAIYCDKTLINSDIAHAFLKVRPDVTVIYESEELTAWWQLLNDDWKSVFRSKLTLDKEPTREQLHELTYLKKLNISGNRRIKDLNPLAKLTSLEDLNVSGTGIAEISAIKEISNLRNLDLSDNGIVDLSPVAGLKSLELLDISNSKITEVNRLSGLRNLRILSLDHCAITQAAPLLNLKRLELLYAEGVPAVEGSVMHIWDSIPDVLIIYQTKKLQDWWNGLSGSWKSAFNSVEPVSGTPSPEQLHKVASIRSIELIENQNLFDLHPLRMLSRLENVNISRMPVTDVIALSSNSRLKEFNCSNTPVADIKPLAANRKMTILNISNTQIHDIEVIQNFSDLKKLDISGTKVTRLSPVTLCKKLEQLDCYNTKISNIKALEDMPMLKLLRIYNTRVTSRSIEKFKMANPGIEVVFY
ncbi:MAG: leucine-rich repeat domain-containing protein [Bacteroidota bacterium]